jgi:hypothetical protein
MRPTCTSIFLVTLLSSWIFFAWLGDYNMYISYADGSRTIKEIATLEDRIVFGFVFASLFAAVDTTALWLWHRFRAEVRES